MELLCRNCNKRPVFIKKRGLCRKCYNKLRSSCNMPGLFDEDNFNPTEEKIYSISSKELEFINNFFYHSAWLYEAVTFHFGMTSYTPDFYDTKRDVYIEVAGSRQAYHKNKEKYDLMAKRFPLVELEIRTPNGELLDVNNPMWREAGAN